MIFNSISLFLFIISIVSLSARHISKFFPVWFSQSHGKVLDIIEHFRFVVSTNELNETVVKK